MKKLSAFLLTTISVVVFAQSVSNYEYVFVPTKFKDFTENQYQLNSQLEKLLASKKYKIVTENSTDVPSSIIDNPCSRVKVDLFNDSSFLKNRIKVVVSDCNSKVIVEYKGGSSEKDYELGFKESLLNAMRTFPMSSPVETEKLIAATPQQVAVKKTPILTESVSTNGQAEMLSNGKVSVQKITLSKTQFILAKANSPVPYATFKSTTKPDVYRVVLENGLSTIGYLENGAIVIEIPSGEDFVRDVFQKR